MGGAGGLPWVGGCWGCPVGLSDARDVRGVGPAVVTGRRATTRAGTTGMAVPGLGGCGERTAALAIRAVSLARRAVRATAAALTAPRAATEVPPLAAAKAAEVPAAARARPARASLPLRRG